MKRKTIKTAGILLACVFIFGMAGGCSGKTDKADADSKKKTESDGSEKKEKKDPVTIMAAAAASLQYSFEDELIPMFEKEYPYITVEGTYDSSGKLQTQIEQGMQADVFMSAAKKQMETLSAENLADSDSVIDLLENKIVLITGADAENNLKEFTDIADAYTAAIGDPASVPAGQYAQEALMNLGIWDQVSEKASLGTNVTEVLNWVAEGSAQAGIVYATDAAVTDRVKVIAEAPEGSLAENVIYPVGIVSNSEHKEEAQLFIDFLKSDKAFEVFETYGFTPNK